MTATEIATRTFYMAEAQPPMFHDYATSKGLDIASTGLRVTMGEFVEFAEALSAAEIQRHADWLEIVQEFGV